jgi:hypothetical protein
VARLQSPQTGVCLRELVGWRCYCKPNREVCRLQLNTRGRVVGSGWDADGRVKWTRRDRTSASRIDFAVRLGGGESWVEYDPEWCEGARTSREPDTPVDLLSDHALCTVAAVVAAEDVLRGQERIRSNRLEERGARRLFEERLSSCGVCQDVEFVTILTPHRAGWCPRVRVPGGTFREGSGTAGECRSV